MKYRNGNWLYEQYWKNSRTAPSMADECGITKRAIHYWMNKQGVPLRTTSAAKSGEFHPMYGKHHSKETIEKIKQANRNPSGT